AGDSLAYHLHDREVIKRTRDQTYVQQLIDEGRMSPAEAATSPSRNVLVSHIGTSRCSPQVALLEVEPGDRFVLCSDGLVEGLGEADLHEVLTRCDTEDAARTLIECACANLVRDGSGTSDNMTAVVVEVLVPESGQLAPRVDLPSTRGAS